MIHSPNLSWRMLLVPLLWLIVLWLPWLVLRLQRARNRGQEKSVSHYDAWKREYFDGRGRCRKHPSYDGTSEPEPGCDGCSVIHTMGRTPRGEWG